MTQELAVQDLPIATNLEQHMTAGDLTKQAQLIYEILTKVMIGPTPEHPEGIHYGIVPGTKKPTLLQPGAEKICATFKLAPKYNVEDLSEPHNNFYRYRVTCLLYTIRDGLFVGSAIGEASSAEEKFAWQRAICPEQWENEESSRRRLKYFPKGNGFETVQQVQRNAADIANTVLKIGCKRSFISATRGATAASDLLDVDMDEPAVADMARQEQGEQAPAPKPKAKAAPAPSFAYGKHKGQKITDPAIELNYLEFMAASYALSLDDPAKAKFKDQNRLFLAALDAEVASRQGKPGPSEAQTEKPAETKPAMQDAPWDEFIALAAKDYALELDATVQEFKSEPIHLNPVDRWAFFERVNTLVGQRK